MEQNVYSDCWQLLQHFVGKVDDDSQDAKFELFCDSWHEMQMQHIYSAHTNNIEVIQTTMAALHMAKRVACRRGTNGEPFEATRLQRIGAIYLLYVIYNKQPTKHFVKIEISPSTWHTLVSYVEELRRTDAQRSDTQQVSYILWQLVEMKAFRHTALDYCQALDGLAAYDNLESIAIAKQSTNRNAEARAAAELLQQQLRPSGFSLREELHGLTELSSICKPLVQLEEAYNKQMTPHRSSFPATKIFSQLQQIFSEIDDVLKEDEPPKPTTSSESNDQLNVRSRVRNKAMFGAEKPKMPTEKEPDPPSPKPSHPHERRMSSATVFKRRLPDDVIKDLEM